MTDTRPVVQEPPPWQAGFLIGRFSLLVLASFLPIGSAIETTPDP